MAISHHNPETERTAHFIAATACLSKGSPFFWDTTGGHAGISNFDATGGQPRMVIHASSVESSITVNPISESLETIQTAFGLNRIALAEICEVSRGALYKWINGKAAPTRQHQKRIFTLREAALNWVREAYPNPKSHLHEPIMAGETLLDLLKENPGNVQRILFAGQRLKLAELDNNIKTIPDPFE